MAKVPLRGGAYTARSIIANAQRCVNLYGEANPEDAPAPMTYYPTPGLTTLGTPPAAGAGRGLYAASSGQLYAVVGSNLYAVSSSWTFTLVGALKTSSGMVSMADNQTLMCLVDGPNGYSVNLVGNTFAQISDPAFYGADKVDFADTFFIFNKPATGQFYISPSNSLTGFDPLYYATKIGASDLLATVAVVHRELWLIGAQKSSEIWINQGGTDFPFGIMNGAFIQHGCEAKYSVAQMGDALFWLSQDNQGGKIVVRGQGYQTQRVSTHAIEAAMSSYSTVSDAVGWTYQQQGHQFYVLTFPTADKTWCLDIVTGEWHERVWLDTNGAEHRHRGISAAYAYGVNVVQDWQTGALYALDLNNYTDAGQPIIRRRGFPHMQSDGKRVFYSAFIADMEAGTDPASISQASPAYVLAADGSGNIIKPDVVPVYLGMDSGSFLANPQSVYLRYSDDRGATWSNPIDGGMGYTGQYVTSILFRRLGMARDRVFELFWSAPIKTALNGAYVEAKAAAT